MFSGIERAGLQLIKMGFNDAKYGGHLIDDDDLEDAESLMGLDNFENDEEFDDNENAEYVEVFQDLEARDDQTTTSPRVAEGQDLDFLSIFEQAIQNCDSEDVIRFFMDVFMS